MCLLVTAQRQPDDVDVVFLDRPAHRGTPTAADVQQGHSGFQAKFAQRQVDLRELRFLERHIVVLEECATVRPCRVEEELKEVVGEVVMGLNVLEVRL